MLRRGGKIELLGRELLPLASLRIPGPHNVENACAAALAASLMGTPDAAIAKALEDFEGVEHRLEDAGEIDGVRFVNDSKGTNVDSVVKALESFRAAHRADPGRAGQGGGFHPFDPPHPGKGHPRGGVRGVQGQGGRPTLPGGHGGGSRHPGGDGQGSLGREREGGTVLFSPGCASFDMFQNYEDRGRQFKALVKHLRESRTGATKG